MYINQIMLLLSWIAFWMEAGYFRTAWLNARVMTRCDFLRHCLQMSTIWLASKPHLCTPTGEQAHRCESSQFFASLALIQEAAQRAKCQN